MASARYPSSVQEPPPIEERFASLVEQWRSATAVSSSVVEMAMHPAYQRIIGMGPPAIPLILHELERRPDHWFWALNAISGEDPAKPEDDFDGAVSAWLKWGSDKGYLG